MAAPHQDLAALMRIAERQSGVVGDADLRACGFSADATARRVQSGRWQRIGGAVLLPEAAAEEADRRTPWILLHTYGAEAAISGALALRRAGWALPVDDVIVVIPHRARRSVPGVTELRRAPGRVQLTREGLVFARSVDALCDSLIVAGARRRDDIVDVALQKRLIDPDDFGRMIGHRLGRGHNGARILREAHARMTTGSRSEAEQRMGCLLVRSRTGRWTPNLAIRDQRGRVLAEIDFAREDLLIAIEVDGRAHHSDRRSFERDRARQNALTLRGWLVLRFTWEQITGDPEWVIATVLEAVRLRLAA
jgi:very-short-patch-repair endonuclease